MTPPRKDSIFFTLNQSRNTNDNNIEYWLYTDLYNLFGTPTFDPENMYEHIYHTIDTTPAAKQNIEPLDFIKNHAIIYPHNYQILSPHAPYNTINKHGCDLKLSRYACYCLFCGKPHLMFTRTYFMIPNSTFETIYETSYDFARIYQRDKLRRSERILSGALKKLNANHSFFQREMTRTLYGGCTIDEIRNTHKIPNNIPLADYMGAISLHARRHAIDNTINAFNFAYTRDLRSLCIILHDELRKARVQMIETNNIAPEQDFKTTPINQATSKFKNLQKEFTKTYAIQNLNTI